MFGKTFLKKPVFRQIDNIGELVMPFANKEEGLLRE